MRDNGLTCFCVNFLDSLIEKISASLSLLSWKEPEHVLYELRLTRTLLRTAGSGRDNGSILQLHSVLLTLEKLLHETEYILERTTSYLGCNKSGSSINKFWINIRFLNRVSARRKAKSDFKFLVDSAQAINKKLEFISGEKEYVFLNLPCVGGENEKDIETEDCFVGMEDEVEKIVSSLEGDNEGSSVTGIYGMCGLGKTTLARKVFHEVGARGKFEGFGWSNVTRRFQTRSVLEDILFQLVPESEEEVMPELSNLELVLLLYDALKSRRCLVVLDDIWSIEDWRCLSVAFPSPGSQSRILLITESKDVAEEIIAQNGNVHEIRPLSDDESWKLFLQKAASSSNGEASESEVSSSIFPSEAVDNQLLLSGEMHDLIQDLMKKFNGMPLAITLLGSLMEKRHSLRDWKEMHHHINMYHISDQHFSQPQFSQMSQILGLNHYYCLPQNLKPCFLYLGLFPLDLEINAEKLYLLWIAEGMIPSTTEQSESTMMDTAESYLYQLATRNMVMVREGEASNISRFKTCKLHPLMRDVCLKKAESDGFLVVKGYVSPSNNLFRDSSNCPSRSSRVAAYLGTGSCGDCKHINFDSEHDTTTLQSLLLFHKRTYSPDRSLEQFTPSFKDLLLLRTLHFDGLNFQGVQVSKAIDRKARLKYLSINGSYSLPELPASLGNLTNMEILDLRVTPSTKLIIPNVLWKMGRLRHLFLPLKFCPSGKGKLRLGSLKCLETLKNFDARVCNAEDLVKLINLRQLEATTEGNLWDLMAILTCMSTTSKYICQAKLHIRMLACHSADYKSIFSNLLHCQSLHTLKIDGHFGKLPQVVSNSLIELSLTGSALDEDPMPVLEKFPRLAVLTLKDDAFLGDQMVCSTSGFPQLTRLKLSNLRKLEKWKIEEGTMLNLSSLEIARCPGLEEFHNAFTFFRNLKKLRITKRSVLERARGHNQDFGACMGEF